MSTVAEHASQLTAAATRERTPLSRIIGLHLLPGAAIFLAYRLAAPYVLQSGFPPTLALNLAFLFVGIPLELGILYYLGSERSDRSSLQGIVLWRRVRPLWPYLLICLSPFRQPRYGVPPSRWPTFRRALFSPGCLCGSFNLLLCPDQISHRPQSRSF